MEDKIKDVYHLYRNESTSATSLREAVRELYRRYIKHREEPLLDAIAASVAVVAYFLTEQGFDPSQISPQIAEAFHLQYPNLSLESLGEYSPEQLEGIVQGLKGKYFEVLVRDKLNDGDWVGPIHLEPGQYATLADHANQPGWDLLIHNSDGSVAQELQLKATESLSYIKSALEQNPDIHIVTTDDLFDSAGGIAGNLVDHLSNAGISDDQLTDTIQDVVSKLHDYSSILESVHDWIPGLPFVIIAVTEGRQVLMGKKTASMAMANGLNRLVKTGISMGAGTAVSLLVGSGLAGIPVAILTRVGIDRYSIAKTIVEKMDRQTKVFQYIRDTYRRRQVT